MSQLRPLVSVFIVLLVCCSLGKDVSETIDENTWLDPGDMLSDLPSFVRVDTKDLQQTVKLNAEQMETPENDPSAPSSLTITQQNCDLPHFKQLARNIIESFPTAGKRYATIELSDDDLKMLREFKDIDAKGERIADVSQLITDIFKHIQDNERLEQDFYTHILLIVDYNKEIFAMVFIVSLLIFILLIFETRTTMTWYRQCWYLFGLLFIVSIPWEWFRLYRKEYAEKQAKILNDIPAHCIQKNMTILARMSLWMSGLLTWHEDDCTKFQEAILVDPMWEVSPSLALSATATRFCFAPMKYIANSCGESLSAFLKHVPTVWQPVMVVILTVVILFCVFSLTKSRIRFGFFELGPGVTHARLPNQDIDALRNCIRQEMRQVIRRNEIAPVRERNLEEFPRIGAAVQEERADEPAVSRGVRETESAEYEVPFKENQSK